MKNILTYIILIVPLLVFSQDVFNDKNSSVLDYRQYVENLSDTTLVILKNDMFTNDNYDGGSQLTGVFYKNKLIKISSWFGLSFGINTCEYYLKEGELFFVEEKFKGFKYDSEKNKYNYSEFDIYAQGWYLFKSGNLVETKSLGHWRFENDSIDPQSTLISEFNEYSKMLIKK